MPTAPSTPEPGGPATPARFDLFPFVAAGLLFLIALQYARNPELDRDLFIYRLGALFGAQGNWPYDVPKVRAVVAEQFPDPDPKFDSFVNNNGYFPPPLAILVYLPFAMLPWSTAKTAWAVTMALAGYAIARLPEAFRGPDTPPGPLPVLWRAAGVGLVLNFLSVAIIAVGQTPLVCVACVVAGQWCFDRGGRVGMWIGALLWAVPFVKPHLALPLIPLAWYLGGWKRAAALVAVVGALNLVGATLAGGSPLKLIDYLKYVPSAHKEVVYNRAELNPQITSWNRLLFSLGGPLVELSIVTTVAGYMVWGGLVLGRCAATGEYPSRSWALASAAVGGMLCCQVLGYESLALVLTIPWIRDLFVAGRRWQGTAGALLLLLQQFPREMFEPVGIDFHRSLGVLAFAILVLIGPVAPRVASVASRAAPDAAPKTA